jgi:hypothetical protein
VTRPGQEYCLECGLRLDGGGGLVQRLADGWRRRFSWYPGDWIWPVAFGLVVAVVAAIAAILVAGSGNGRATPVATQPGRVQEPVTPPATETVAVPTVPQGTPTTSGPPQTPSTPPPTTTAPAPGGLTVWPAGRSGWTVVLASIPTRAGRAFAVSRARSAANAGLASVGVLVSGLYSSLHPGYYVVFSGVYASKSEADAAARTAAAKGFRTAYSREITR